MAPLSPAEVERLRENSHIKLDADGRFWHEGGLVEHAGVARAFHRGLGRAPDGRPTLTIGRTWCYLTADDTLYLVRAALCEPAGERLSSCLLRLDDETEEQLELVPAQVALGETGVLYARVKNGREWARLLPEAHRTLGTYVTAADADPNLLALKTTAGSFPLVALKPPR